MAIPFYAQAAIVAGLSGIYAWLNREDSKDAFESTERLRPERRRAGAASQMVIGNARTGGTVFYEADSEAAGTLFRPGSTAPTDGYPGKIRTLYRGNLLSEGVIDGVYGAWVDGNRAPLDVPTGSTAPPRKSHYSWSAINVEFIEALFGRMNALIPGSVKDATTVGQSVYDEDVLDAADAVQRALWEDMRAEADALYRVWEWQSWVQLQPKPRRRWSNGWEHRWGASSSAPAFRLTWGDGTTGDAQGTAPAVARARARAPGWRDTDICEGVAWTLAEFRCWPVAEKDQADKLWPWATSSVPSLELLVRGDPAIASAQPAHGANPCLAAGAVLERFCDVERSAFDGRVTGADACNELVTLPPVSIADPQAPTATLPITGPQVLAAYYGDNLPSPAVQQRVLHEWNLREAGARNARPRYVANGIVDGDMSRDDVIDSFGMCMGGSIQDIGGKWRFRPGVASTTAIAIAPAQIVGDAVEIIPDSGAGSAPNSLQAVIAQDRERGWTRSSVPPVDDDVYVRRDGLYRRTIKLPFVNDMLDAQRLLHLYLRRDSYGLRRVRFRMRAVVAAAYNLLPSSKIQVEVEGLNMDMRVTAITPDRGTVEVEAVELTDNTYSTAFLLPSTDRDFTEPPRSPSDYDLTARYDTAFRADAGDHRLDIRMLAGADAVSMRVRVVKRPNPADTTKTTTAFEYVLTGERMPDAGETFSVQAAPPPDADASPQVALAINPDPQTVPLAAFNEGADYAIDVEVTCYSLSPYSTANAGGTRGATNATTLVGPGEPTSGGGGLRVEFDGIRTVAQGGPAYLEIVEAKRVRALPAEEGVKLVWKLDDGDWQDAVVGVGDRVGVSRGTNYTDREFDIEVTLDKTVKNLLLAAQKGTRGTPPGAASSTTVIADNANLAGIATSQLTMVQAGGNLYTTGTGGLYRIQVVDGPVVRVSSLASLSSDLSGNRYYVAGDSGLHIDFYHLFSDRAQTLTLRRRRQRTTGIQSTALYSVVLASTPATVKAAFDFTRGGTRKNAVALISSSKLYVEVADEPATETGSANAAVRAVLDASSFPATIFKPPATTAAANPLPNRVHCAWNQTEQKLYVMLENAARDGGFAVFRVAIPDAASATPIPVAGVEAVGALSAQDAESSVNTVGDFDPLPPFGWHTNKLHHVRRVVSGVNPLTYTWDLVRVDSFGTTGTTGSDDLEYSTPAVLGLRRDVITPDQFIKVVSAAPTSDTPGRFTGELAFTVESA